MTGQTPVSTHEAFVTSSPHYGSMPSPVDRCGCIGNTIKVAAGHYVDLGDPSPSSIELESIASALSKICRFGGHCPRFYSVAEHCIHATLLASKSGYAGDALKSILLHDAAEAYIGDMVKPLKCMCHEYTKIEAQMEKAIAEKFGLSSRWQQVVKRFDLAMLKAEKIRMWPQDKEAWTGFSEIEDREVEFRFWTPKQAKMQFLNMASVIGV